MFIFQYINLLFVNTAEQRFTLDFSVQVQLLLLLLHFNYPG